MSDDELPDADAGEVLECEACGEFLPLCRCQGRCFNCLKWKTQCVCKGRPKRGRPSARRAEWLCFECEEPLEYCQCDNRVWENLARGLIGIKDPRRKRQAQRALVALALRIQGKRVNPRGSGIDYSEPKDPPNGRRKDKWPKRLPPGA